MLPENGGRAFPHKRDRFAKHQLQVQRALVRGRHPKSIAPAGALWSYVDDSTTRLRLTANGKRRLHSVNEEIEQQRKTGAASGILEDGKTTTATPPLPSSPVVKRTNSASGTSTPNQAISRGSRGGRRTNKVLQRLNLRLNDYDRARGHISPGLRSFLNSRGQPRTPIHLKRPAAAEHGSTTNIYADPRKQVAPSEKDFEKMPRRTNVPLPEQVASASKHRGVTLSYGACVCLRSVVHRSHYLTFHTYNGTRNLAGDVLCSNPAAGSLDDDVVVFKVIDLHNPQSVGPVHFDDDIWLLLCDTPESKSCMDIRHFVHGSVVGVRMLGGKELPTVDLEQAINSPNRHERRRIKTAHQEHDRQPPPPTQAHKPIRGNARPTMLGRPGPTLAYFPQDDAPFAEQELNLVNKNLGADFLGRWKLRPATSEVRQRARQRPNADTQKTEGVVMTYDEVYLEQDCFYALVDDFHHHRSTTGDGSSLGSDTQDKHKPSSHSLMLAPIPTPHERDRQQPWDVDRRGVWSLEVTDSGMPSAMSKFDRTTHLRMERARKWLAHSESMRNGDKEYFVADYSRLPEKLKRLSTKERDELPAQIDRRRRHGFLAAPTTAEGIMPKEMLAGDSIRGGDQFASSLRLVTVNHTTEAEQRITQRHNRKEHDAHRYFSKLFDKHGLSKDFLDEFSLESPTARHGPGPGRQGRKSSRAAASSSASVGGAGASCAVTSATSPARSLPAPAASRTVTSSSSLTDMESLGGVTATSPSGLSMQSHRSLWSYEPGQERPMEVHHTAMASHMHLPRLATGGGASEFEELDDRTIDSEITTDETLGNTFVTSLDQPESEEAFTPITLSWPLDLSKEDRSVLRDMTAAPRTAGFEEGGIRLTSPLSNLRSTPALLKTPTGRMHSLSGADVEDEQDVGPLVDEWQQQWLAKLKPNRVDKVAKLLEPTDEQIQMNNEYAAKHAQMKEVLDDPHMKELLRRGSAIG